MTPSSFLRKGLVTCIGLLILPWALAQQPPAGGGGTGGGTGGGAGGGGSKGGDTSPKVPATPTKPQVGNNQEQQPRMPQTLFISGVAVMEDGSNVPPDAVVERTCQGRVTREAHVSPGGGFSFQVGGNSRLSSVMPDASEEFHDFSRPDGRNAGFNTAGLSSTSFASLMGCEISVQLAGYRSTRITLDGSNTMGQIDVGTILLFPIARVNGTMVSATNLNAPKPAKKAFEKAQSAFQKRKFDEAEKNLKQAIELYPKYAAALTGLGDLYQATSRLPEARKAYESAIALDDKYVTPYISLARLAGMERNWQQTAELTDRALLLDPVDFPEGYYFNAIAHFNLNNFDAAERSARKVQMMDPKHRMPQAFMIMANILERKQDISGAMDQLEKYLSAAPQAPNITDVRAWLDKLKQASKPMAERK